MLTRSEGIASSISRSRALIGIILFGCLGLALVLSVFIVRALQAQIDQFLSAARRLAKGDFSQPVPIHGKDEFAALGVEFNNMSQELANKIEEVESKRRELEETIRRVGEAFAAGLDRQGLLDLAVRQAVEACEADAGAGARSTPGRCTAPTSVTPTRRWWTRSRPPREGPSRSSPTWAPSCSPTSTPRARSSPWSSAGPRGVGGRGAGAGGAAEGEASTVAPT